MSGATGRSGTRRGVARITLPPQRQRVLLHHLVCSAGAAQSGAATTSSHAPWRDSSSRRARSHQQREHKRQTCAMHAAGGRWPSALPADTDPAPLHLPGCQPRLWRPAPGAWRAPGDAAVSAATAACAMAARCAASRQRGRADNSSEYATRSCARAALTGRRRCLRRGPCARVRTRAPVQGVCRRQGCDATANAKTGALLLTKPCQP